MYPSKNEIGLLKVGVPKTWNDSRKDLAYIRKAGVRQFISTYNRVKDLKGDDLLWGDEIEYGVFKMDKDSKKARLSLRAKEVRIQMLRKQSMDKMNLLTRACKLTCFVFTC